jgi:hypothetical protein
MIVDQAVTSSFSGGGPKKLEKEKKTISDILIELLGAKKVDKDKIKEEFLRSQSASMPQELRLILWKLFLGTNFTRTQIFSYFYF